MTIELTPDELAFVRRTTASAISNLTTHLRSLDWAPARQASEQARHAPRLAMLDALQAKLKPHMAEALAMFARLIDAGDDPISAASWVFHETGINRSDLFKAAGICEVM